MRCARLFAILLSASLLTASATATATAALPVLVSVPPHADLVARIAGDLADVRVLVGAAQSPHTYDPTPRELAQLTSARVWLRTGLAMENTLAGKLERVAPDLAVVDLRAGLDLIAAGDACGDHGHAHGEHGELHDPHIWLSPRGLRAQAVVAARALSEADPGHATTYEANLAALQDSLTTLDQELAALLAPVAGRTFVVFHPAFGYFARDYGLTQVAIEAGGIDPSPRHLAGVLEGLRRDGARAIFLQPQYAGGSVRALAAEAGLRVIELDPYGPDLLASLRRVGTLLRRELEAAAP